MANAALALVYGHAINWRSPTYASSRASGVGVVTVTLNDVEGGLVIKDAHNRW